MIATSPEFTAAANADIRYPRAKVEILWTDPNVQSGNTVTTTDHNNLCNLSSTVKTAMLQQTVDTKDVLPYKFIINDGTFVNDGTWHPAPSTVEEMSSIQFGWWTAESADESGDFATPPELTVTFANPRAIGQIRVFGYSVAGFSALDQYPTAFEIYVMNSLGNVINTVYEFTGSSVETIVDFSNDEIGDAKYIRLVLNSWSEPSTVGKITEFFGVISTTMYGDDIVSMDILEEMQGDGTTPYGNMSCNELRLELQNVEGTGLDGALFPDPYVPDNTGSYLRNAVVPNVRLTPYLGFKIPEVYSESVSVIKTTVSITMDANTLSHRYGVYYDQNAIGVSLSIVDEYGITVEIDEQIIELYYCIVTVRKLTGTSGSYKLQINGKAVSIPTYYEYVKMGSFWSTDWNVSEWNFGASVTARDRLEILRLNEFTLDTVPINYSMYQIAELVLNHAKTYIPLNDLKWSIDSLLSAITVPYAWFGKNVTYFEALSQITDAVLGRCYMNRDDVLVIESYFADMVSGTPDTTITADDYFSCDRPVKSSSIKNRVVVPASEFMLDESGDITTTDEITMGSGDTTKDVLVEWGDDAVLEPLAVVDSEDGITVSFSTPIYYPWGCSLTATKLTGTEGTFKVKVTGKKLVLNKVTSAVAENADSIALYKKRTLELPQNFLIQTPELAQLIADNLLLSSSDANNECSVEICGNPATEIGDISNIEVYSKLSVMAEFRRVKQQFKFDGGLRCMVTCKKTIDYGT